MQEVGQTGRLRELEEGRKTSIEPVSEARKPKQKSAQRILQNPEESRAMERIVGTTK